MTPEELRTLVDYNYWATYRVLDAVASLTTAQFTEDLGSSFPSVRDTLSHLHGAEWVWMSRLRGESPRAFPPRERFPDAASVRRAWTDTETNLRAYVGGLDRDAAERVLDYRGFGGQPAGSRVDHIIQHLVNHGSYHRGQLTTMLRQLGAAAPASLDLIAYYRERAR